MALDSADEKTLTDKFPQLIQTKGPIVILVPGGAFGPSKFWLADRFAQVADRLIDKYNATVIISVSPNPLEQQCAKQICDISTKKLINLADNPLTIGELKSLFSLADLVITTDTGPRHMAIALRRKVVTLFGPNDPAWTDTGYENEIKIIGNATCVPCQKPTCRESEHLCMQAITVEMVSEAAQNLLKKDSKS